MKKTEAVLAKITPAKIHFAQIRIREIRDDKKKEWGRRHLQPSSPSEKERIAELKAGNRKLLLDNFDKWAHNLVKGYSVDADDIFDFDCVRNYDRDLAKWQKDKEAAFDRIDKMAVTQIDNLRLKDADPVAAIAFMEGIAV